MNLIRNGDFAEGREGWGNHRCGLSVVDGAARVTVDEPGDNLQLYQAGIVPEAGTRYRLTFWASSNDGSDMGVYLHQHDAPYADYGLGYVAWLGSERGEYSVEFMTPDVVPAEGRLRFSFGKYAKSGTVYSIDNVRLEAVVAELPQRPARRIHVIAPRLEAGDEVEVRIVRPGGIVLTAGGDIDWDATRWRLVAVYAEYSD